MKNFKSNREKHSPAFVNEYIKKLSELLDIPINSLDIKRGISTIDAQSIFTKDSPLYLEGPGKVGVGDKNFYVGADDLITRFNLTMMPSCCAFCISHGVYVYNEYRDKGVNSLTNKFRQELAKYWGFPAIICTDVKHNIAERKTLKKNGWKDIYEINNTRTGNDVVISVKDLRSRKDKIKENYEV